VRLAFDVDCLVSTILRLSIDFLEKTSPDSGSNLGLSRVETIVKKWIAVVTQRSARIDKENRKHGPFMLGDR
jgi:hypothetical protein